MRKCIAGIVMLLMVMIAFASMAAARDSAGRLWFDEGPTSTRPAFVRSGDKIDLNIAATVYNSCSCAFHAYIVVGGQHMEMPTARVESSSTSTYRFLAAVPTGLMPGLYDIVLMKGANNEQERRAINVVEKFPEDYTILHITDVRFGSEKNGVPVAAKMFDSIRDKANELKPDMVIITGDVTENGSSEQLKGFVDALNGFQSPTIVVAGDNDDRAGQAVSFLGPGMFGFPFGDQYFIGFDTHEEFKFPDATGQWDALKLLAGAHSGAKFLAMFSHRFESKQRRVTSDILNPNGVKLLLLGDRNIDSVEKVGRTPTMAITTQSAMDGCYRVVHVRDGRIVEMKAFKLKGATSDLKKKGKG